MIAGTALPQESKGAVTIKLKNLNLRPGEYPLYLGLANDRREAFDVMDGLTTPLIISTDKTVEDLGYDPTKPCGFFDIESELKVREK
jgi:hypothetical protein